MNPEKLMLNGVVFLSTREQIEMKFGEPDQIIAPMYECGFLSAEEQGMTFYSLIFSGCRFTGNEAFNYLLEEVDLVKNPSLELTYDTVILNSITEKNAFANLLGLDVETDSTSILAVKLQDSDAVVEFIFKNERLVKMRYWSPC